MNEIFYKIISFTENNLINNEYEIHKNGYLVNESLSVGLVYKKCFIYNNF